MATKEISSVADRLVAGQAHHQKAHGDPVIHVGHDVAAAGDLALAVHEQVVADDFVRDAIGLEPGGDRIQAVGFLDAQFGEPAHRGRAFGEGRGHREHRIFVDHRRRAGGGNFDALERRGAHAQIGDRLAALLAPFQLLDLRAHFPERRDQARAQRIHQHAFENNVRARNQKRRDQRKCGRRRIGRHAHALRLQFRPALEHDAPAARAMRRDFQLGAEMDEHALGMIAGRFLLDQRGLARRREPAQQHRRFHLCRGDRALVLDRDRVARALELERQPAAFGLLHDLGAHARERIEHAAHRPLAQAGIAVEHHLDRMAGDDPQHQPRAGAGIAEIERRAGRQKRADARALHAPGPRSHALKLGPERATSADGGERIVPFQQALDPGLAHRQQAEHERAVGDRLVAGHANAALERARAAGDGGPALGLWVRRSDGHRFLVSVRGSSTQPIARHRHRPAAFRP